MRDDEDGTLRPPDDPPKPGRIASDQRLPSLAAARRLGRRVVLERPRDVVVERATFVAAVQRVVELGQHDAWNRSLRERDIRGLARPLELRCHAEIDVVAGDLLAEGARLRLAALAQGASDVHPPRREPSGAEDTLAVADKQRSLHSSALCQWTSPATSRSPPAWWTDRFVRRTLSATRATPRSPTASMPVPMIVGAIPTTRRSTSFSAKNDVITRAPPSTRSEPTPSARSVCSA